MAYVNDEIYEALGLGPIIDDIEEQKKHDTETWEGIKNGQKSVFVDYLKQFKDFWEIIKNYASNVIDRIWNGIRSLFC